MRLSVFHDRQEDSCWRGRPDVDDVPCSPGVFHGCCRLIDVGMNLVFRVVGTSDMDSQSMPFVENQRSAPHVNVQEIGFTFLQRSCFFQSVMIAGHNGGIADEGLVTVRIYIDQLDSEMRVRSIGADKQIRADFTDDSQCFFQRGGNKA